MAKVLLERAMTVSVFEAAKARALQRGILIAGASGELTGSGVTVRYVFDGKMLKVELVKKPWLVPEGTVRKKITEMFDSLGCAV